MCSMLIVFINNEFFIDISGVHTFQQCLDLWGSKYFIGGPCISSSRGPCISSSRGPCISSSRGSMYFSFYSHEKLDPRVHFWGGGRGGHARPAGSHIRDRESSFHKNRNTSSMLKSCRGNIAIVRARIWGQTTVDT